MQRFAEFRFRQPRLGTPRIPGHFLYPFLYPWGTCSIFGVADDLGGDNWLMGPKLLLGKMTPGKIYILSSKHQWDVTGSGDPTSISSIQTGAIFLIGGGWAIGSLPEMMYDWKAEQWNIPITFNFSKTVILRSRPWKLGGEISYYAERPDTFSPEWLFGINITPVVKNVWADFF